MNINIRCLFATTLALTACDLSDDQLFESDLDPTPTDAGSGESAAPAAPHDEPVLGTFPLVECPGVRHVVGILQSTNSSCSLGGTLPEFWDWKVLFEEGSPTVESLTTELPDELQRFCFYTFTGPSAPKVSDYEQLFTTIDNYDGMSIDTVGVDCMGETPQGGLDDPAIGGALQDAMLDNVQAPLELPDCTNSEQCVKIVFADTQTQDWGSPDFAASDHANNVASISRTLLGPAWPAELLDFENAFPGESGDDGMLNWYEGGVGGSNVTLALAILGAVAHWREDLEQPDTPRRLVINASVGYDRLLVEPLEASRGPTAALLAALQYASCSGAMTFVAAGNNIDEACPQNRTGPLAPASFETIAAPTAAECDVLDFLPSSDYLSSYPHDPRLPSATYTPLVFAVGGVDPRDEPLMNARLDGEPSLVAYSEYGVGTSVNGTYNPAVTGTSMAAAIASGGAAGIWCQYPELSSFDIYELLYRSGYPTERDADFTLGGATREVRRLSYCAALADACEAVNPQQSCPSCEAEGPAVDGNLGSFDAVVDAILSDPMTSVETFAGPPPNIPMCENIPLDELLHQTPPPPMCPHCNIQKGWPAIVDDDALNMSIDPKFTDSIELGWLTVIDTSGYASSYTFEPAVIESLNTSSGMTVVMLEAPEAKSATLHFLTLNSGGAYKQYDNVIDVLE